MGYEYDIPGMKTLDNAHFELRAAKHKLGEALERWRERRHSYHATSFTRVDKAILNGSEPEAMIARDDSLACALLAEVLVVERSGEQLSRAIAQVETSMSALEAEEGKTTAANAIIVRMDVIRALKLHDQCRTVTSEGICNEVTREFGRLVAALDRNSPSSEWHAGVRPSLETFFLCDEEDILETRRQYFHLQDACLMVFNKKVDKGTSGENIAVEDDWPDLREPSEEVAYNRLSQAVDQLCVMEYIRRRERELGERAATLRHTLAHLCRVPRSCNRSQLALLSFSTLIKEADSLRLRALEMIGRIGEIHNVDTLTGPVSELYTLAVSRRL